MDKEMDMAVVLNWSMRLICNEQKARAICVVFKLNHVDQSQPGPITIVSRYYLIVAWKQEHFLPNRQEVSL